MIPKISVGQKTAVLPNLLKQPKGIKTNGKFKLEDLTLQSGQLDKMAKNAVLYTQQKVYAGEGGDVGGDNDCPPFSTFAGFCD